MSRCISSILRCTALALIALPGLGHAYSACAGSAQELNDALNDASASADANINIRVREGVYQAAPGKRFYLQLTHSNQVVNISGGWNAPDCQTKRYGAGGSILIGTDSVSALLLSDGIGNRGNTINATDFSLHNPAGLDNDRGTCLDARVNDATLRLYRMRLTQCTGTAAAIVKNFLGTAVFANSVVSDSYTSQAPVMVETYSGSTTQLAQLSISGNTATSSSQQASGLWLYAAPGFQNHITLDNSVVSGGIAPAGIPDIATDGPGITFTRVHYDTRDSINAVVIDNARSSGDPGFASLTDLHLRGDSMLVDSGVTLASSGTLDVDGRARTLGSAVDVGAYEFDPDTIFRYGFD